MKVVFPDFKNAGAQVYEIKSNGLVKPKLYTLNCELPKDQFDKRKPYIEEIFNAVKRSPLLNFLNLKLWNYKKAPCANFTEDIFCLNNDKYPISDENARLFQNIAKLLNNIIETSDENFKVNKDYIESESCRQCFTLPVIGTDIRMVSELHKPQNVKNIAQIINNAITSAWADYCQVEIN